jgi:hypothetical protein
MYLALFLTPWIAMYALSTIAMNHRAEGGAPPPFSHERTLPFEGVLPGDSAPKVRAAILLTHLDMEGAFTASERKTDGALVIHRNDPLAVRRITYTPSDQRILIERQQYRTSAFLERLHRRRGYQHDFALEDVWAFSVDAVIVSLAFWVLSGLWMWWELRSTRRLGVFSLAAGVALFAFFLAVL